MAICRIKTVKVGLSTETVTSIDHRYADGRFLMSPCGVAVSNHGYLSSSETRVNAVIRGRKLHLSVSTLRHETVGGICFTDK
jgi:hypothetical protein